MEPRLVLVAAVAENGVIGRDNDMPWRLPSDLKRFRALTMGKPVIMGRKTFESIGKPLPGRDNIVVTRSAAFAADGIQVAHSLEEALSVARHHAETRGVNEICVIGGAEIYAQTIGSANVLHITEVHARPDGETRFPQIDPAHWREAARETPQRGEKDSASVSYVTFERR